MMRRFALPLLGVALLASSACSSEESQPGGETDPPVGGGGSGGSSGGSGGAGPSGCPAGTTTTDDGDCVPAGVPEDACGDGFEAVDAGCAPILPDDDCEAGMIAVPGDTSCREIAACGQGTWGDIPTGPNTQFVDASYAGGDSDGTDAKPWTTIQEGIDAAVPDATVAIAAGNYAEGLVVLGKAVRLVGRCPSMVELSSDNPVEGPVFLLPSAAGTEVRGLAITAAGLGVHVQGASDIVLQDLWIHDLEDWAIYVDSLDGEGSITVRNVLIERALDSAVIALNAHATVEAVAIRDTRRTLGYSAAGVLAQDAGLNVKGRMTVTGSLITRSNGSGAYVGGADLELERTAIIDSRVALGVSLTGMGISLQDSPDHQYVGTLALNQTVIDTARTLGIYISGGDAVIENSTLRNITPDQATERLGHGLGIEDHIESARPSTVEVHRSLIELGTETGVSVYGSDLTMTATRVRATAVSPKVEWFGRGVNIQNGGIDPTLRSSVHITDSVIEQNHEAGVMVTSSDLWLDHSAVTDTQPLPFKGLGDGVIIFENDETNAEITDSLVARSARAGVAAFGGNVMLRGNTIECNPIAIGTEILDGKEPNLVDDGGNACVCGDVSETCRAQQSSLEPPQAL